MNDDDLQRQIVLAAIGAAGEARGDVRGWQTRVAEYTGHVAAMLRPPAPGREDDAVTPLVQARKVLDSAVFRAEFVDYEDDVNHKTGVKTHRLLVRFKSDTMNADETEGDGTEHLRTEPSWTRAGWVMQRLVKSLSPGQPCNVFKHKEGFDGTDEKGRAMKKNVRILAHLEVVGRPPESRSPGEGENERPATASSVAGQNRQAPQTSAPAGAQRGAGESQPQQAPPAPESHGPNYTLVQERLEELNARQRVAWAAVCRGKGVSNFMDPQTTEDLDKVLVAFGELAKEEK